MALNTIGLKWGNDEFCIWKDSRVSKSTGAAKIILYTHTPMFLIKTLLIDKAHTYDSSFVGYIFNVF